MRHGCISLGEIQCNDCYRIIPYPERYLTVDKGDDAEIEKGRTLRYCVDCSLKRGYARHRMEKGEQILTFFEE
ncbi:hypothetical protein ACFLTZ_02510 [Chloroflexota bacterium]